MIEIAEIEEVVVEEEEAPVYSHRWCFSGIHPLIAWCGWEAPGFGSGGGPVEPPEDACPTCLEYHKSDPLTCPLCGWQARR